MEHLDCLSYWHPYLLFCQFCLNVNLPANEFLLLIILCLIFFSYLFLAFIGVHPVATIAILLEITSPLFDVINLLSIGLVLIVSALAVSGSSSFGIAVTMTSINTVQSPYKITYQNTIFTFVMGLIGIIIGVLSL